MRLPSVSFWCLPSSFLLLVILPLSIRSLSSNTAVEALSTTPNTANKKTPVKKVAIIGSGIAGLTLAHALENSSQHRNKDGSKIDVSVYDARKSLNYEAGAGVQLNGGMNVLHRMNPAVQRAVADASLPLKKIRSRTKPWFSSNSKNDFDTLLEIPIEDSIRERGGTVEDNLIINNEVMVYTIMRGALQEVLLDTLPTNTAKKVHFDKCLTDIQQDNDDGAFLTFQDGSTEGPFDLIVGCDGINSVVKEFVNNNGEKLSTKKKKKKISDAIYSGIRIKYAVGDMKEIPEKKEATLSQYFGNSAYSLAGIYGNGKNRNPTKCAYLIYADENYFGPFKRRNTNKNEQQNQNNINNNNDDDDENTDWSQDNRISTSDIMLKQIRNCQVPSTEVNPIIKDSTRFFELGVYFHNPFQRWSKAISKKSNNKNNSSYATLCGDSAHAMPPFLGQGSNQAIQDAYCLATKLYDYNNNMGDDSLQEVLQSYEVIRWKPTASISFKSFLLGYLECGLGGTFVSKFRDVFFRTCGTFGIAKTIYFGAAIPEVSDTRTANDVD